MCSELLYVPMRDGVRLAVHLHRPAAAGRYPALLTYTPYRLGPLGPPPAIVGDGYAHVAFDIRGTGNSEGWSDSIYSGPERRDAFEMVEWAARQPWCTGAVGAYGISFGAVAALQLATAAPPHLKAVIARSGSDDPFTEWTNPGGCLRPYIYTCYAPLMSALNFAPPDPVSAGRGWRRVWRQRLDRSVPWGISFMKHVRDGRFWRERAMRGRYDRVRCAVFVVGGWADWYHSPLLRIFSELAGPKRALVGPWSHQWPDAAIPGPRIDWSRERLRWFDQWLKGRDTGLTREPPAALFIREFTRPEPLLLGENGAFRSESEWPPARSTMTPFYFQAGGGLGPTPPSGRGTGAGDTHVFDPRTGASTGFHGGGPFNDNWAMPLDQRAEEGLCLVYSGKPLEADLEVTGWPVARLHVRSTARVTAFCVKLCDVAPDGTSVLVTKGWLNSAYRGSFSEPRPLVPGRPCALDVKLLSCAWRFRRGHRVRVLVSSADILNIWPTPEACENTVYCCPGRASAILLPVTPARTPALPPPALGNSAAPLPERAAVTPPTLEIVDDRLRGTRTVHHAVRYGAHMGNEAWYTVNAGDPARVEARATGDVTVICEGTRVRTEAETLTTSDARRFRHEVTVRVTVDGRKRFEKSWSARVARPMA